MIHNSIKLGAYPLEEPDRIACPLEAAEEEEHALTLVVDAPLSHLYWWTPDSEVGTESQAPAVWEE